MLKIFYICVCCCVAIPHTISVYLWLFKIVNKYKKDFEMLKLIYHELWTQKEIDKCWQKEMQTQWPWPWYILLTFNKILINERN